MSQPAKSYKYILQLIVDILRFDDNHNQLTASLSSVQSKDWDELVRVASDHLVLTTVYCRLKQKQLLKELPEDLTRYLHELTHLNRTRNDTLVKEAHIVGDLLNANHIEYVFIKGMGTLLSNGYQDLGERMIGDFDILIPQKDIHFAHQLLIDNGYNHLIGFNYQNTSFRHLDRQVNNERLAPIELHREVLISSHRELLDLSAIFKDKTFENGIFVASAKHLGQINILTTQLNSQNFYFNRLNLKNVYDSLVLWKENDKIDVEEFNNNVYISRYLSLMSVLNIEVALRDKSVSNQWYSKLYDYKLKSKLIESSVYKAKIGISQVLNRVKLFIHNKSYRHHILNNKIFNKS